MTAAALERLAALADKWLDDAVVVRALMPHSRPTVEAALNMRESCARELRAELAALHAADHDTPAPSGAPEIAEGARR